MIERQTSTKFENGITKTCTVLSGIAAVAGVVSMFNNAHPKISSGLFFLSACFASVPLAHKVRNDARDQLAEIREATNRLIEKAKDSDKISNQDSDKETEAKTTQLEIPPSQKPTSFISFVKDAFWPNTRN